MDDVSEASCPTKRWLRLERSAQYRLDGLRVILEDLCDPGNRAAILRSVEAFGLLHVHEIKGDATLGKRPAQQSSARGRSIVNGAEKWLNLHQHEDVQECIETLQSDGFGVWAAVPPSRSDTGNVELSLDQLPFETKTALLFGSEARGVSTEALRLCDGRFTVPLHGLSESPEARAALGALWDTDTDNLTTELVIWWRDLKGQEHSSEHYSLAMTDVDDLDLLQQALERYCHPEVVEEFSQLEFKYQKVWLDAFSATCHKKLTDEVVDRMAEKALRSRLIGRDPHELDLNDIEMQHSSGVACPLTRAMKSRIPIQQSLWEDLVVPIRVDFLPTWGVKRSRQQLEQRHQQGLEETDKVYQRQQTDSNITSFSSDASTQKPTATRSWSNLVPSCFEDLVLFSVAKGRVVHCEIIADPFVTVAVQLLVEDANRQVMQLQLYNQLPDTRGGGRHEVISKFAKGTKLSIAEPFLKVMNDGYRGIRVDTPADVQVSTPVSDMASLKASGNSAFSQGYFDLAKEKYICALQLEEVEEIVIFLANRAQAFLEYDPVEACKDAAAALMLRPAHQKAGLRYVAALKRSAELLAEQKEGQEGHENHKSMLLLAKRAGTLYSEGKPGEQSVSREDVRAALAVLLSGFGDLSVYRELHSLEFGETSAQCREQANHHYQAGEKLKAIFGYTNGLSKVTCARTVAMVLSNLSQVCLELRESHTAIAFANAALRLDVADLRGKLFWRSLKALEQLDERSFASQLAESIADATDATYQEAAKDFLRSEPLGFRTRVYTNGAAEVYVDGVSLSRLSSKSIPWIPDFASSEIETALVPGKGRGVFATKSIEAGELLIVSHALSLAVAEEDDFTRITSGKMDWQPSTSKLIGRLAYSAASDNEVSWTLSQLCEKPTETKAIVQPNQLMGLSPRWLPLLGQAHCYYPPRNRVFLAKPSIDSIVLINSHGPGKRNTGIFPSACLFNHSAEENCAYTPVKLDSSELQQTLAVMTRRPVREGEELCVCLNVSVCVAVCVHYGALQRRKMFEKTSDMPGDQVDELLQSYADRSLDHHFAANLRSQRSLRRPAASASSHGGYVSSPPTEAASECMEEKRME
eukprot:symbB.v1.2.031316.t1/scaffold3623.1/size53121/2